MTNHWATCWVKQAKDGQSLRLDPCHLPQTIVYHAPQSHRPLTCLLSERGALVQGGHNAENSNILRMLSPRQFRGVAARKIATGGHEKTISLVLLHKNPDYSIPLLISSHHDDVLLDWRLWADIYDLPMLTIDNNGHVSHVMERSPLRHFFMQKAKKPQSRFLLRCRGRSLNIRLVIANQVMLG